MAPLLATRTRSAPRVEIVPGPGKPLVTLDHMHDPVIPVGCYPTQFGPQPLQPALLGKPLGLRRIAFRPCGIPARRELFGCEGRVGPSL